MYFFVHTLHTLRGFSLKKTSIGIMDCILWGFFYEFYDTELRDALLYRLKLN